MARRWKARRRRVRWPESLLMAGCGMQDAGYGMRDTGCAMWDAGYEVDRGRTKSRG